jgi:hypothetical protein
MKKILLLIAFAVFFMNVNAQDTTATATTVNPTPTMAEDHHKADRYESGKRFFLSLGILPNAPVGNFHNLAKFGWGGNLQGEFKPGHVGLTINAGYQKYAGKTVDTISYPDFGYIPVLGGLKVYMGDKAYIHGQAGPGFGTDGLGTSFWYGAGLGFNLRKVDIEFGYMGWKQKEQLNVSNGGVYGQGSGGNNGGGTNGGGYGGHYSTLGLRLAYILN